MVTFEYADQKTLPLSFSLDAWERMEKEVCPLDELFDIMNGSDGNRKQRYSIETNNKMLKIAAIMNADAVKGAYPVTVEALHATLTPGECFDLRSAIMEAVLESLKMGEETEKGDSDK